MSEVSEAPATTTKTTVNTRYLSLAPPEYICRSCHAIMWYEERVKKTSNRRQTNFNMCCREGKIKLDKLKDPPDFLRTLLDYSQGPSARKFRQHIRMYNSSYAFTSMGAKVDTTVNNTPGPYTFRISGQNSHYIGSLLPTGNRTPFFIQLYVYDTSDEIDRRAGVFGKKDNNNVLETDILTGLKQMLDAVNPIAHTFRMAQQRLKEDNNLNLSIRLLGQRVNKDITYSNPTASEIAALIVGDISGTDAGRDIIIEHKRDGLKRITELHPSFMALQYPLLFPRGEDSFHTDIPYIIDVTKKRGKREYVTMREYYAYRLQQRLMDGYAVLRGGKLLHQFVVDCCCAIESQRLWFIRNNQPYLRCEMLNHLCDAVDKGDYVGAEVGTRIILPASFTGSMRYMQQKYQDAMAICRWFGNPHLFITFTANPKWPEIDQMLAYIQGQKAEDRPDIIARVFRLKLRQLMDCLKHQRYFGTTVADVYTIEFQKRGLPHAHILLWLKKDEVELSPQYIDGIIHAEIPDKEKDPVLYEIVSWYMVHGPCGKENPNCPCMLDGVTCNKKYPKSFNSETAIDRNGYPVYRRRENKRTIKKGKHVLDNRSIVPYNPGLLLMFDAHINVEWCNTARAIKYLFKYILKGPDKATAIISRDKEDEIKSYLDCHYLSACEGAWKIFEFEIHERSPAVIRLPVHLEGEQAVVLKDKDKLRVVIDKANESPTMLMGWMTANINYVEAANLTYAQMPTRFVWRDNAWKLR
ncbi:uncharacterized protein LOC141632755 [Silene latifolia]|uniref:uncharacterized protein LOC141632755 n=1 Tax=Silene latifolia TaxID=37657 RepID=UPI003D78ACF2